MLGLVDLETCWFEHTTSSFDYGHQFMIVFEECSIVTGHSRVLDVLDTGGHSI